MGCCQGKLADATDGDPGNNATANPIHHGASGPSLAPTQAPTFSEAEIAVRPGPQQAPGPRSTARTMPSLTVNHDQNSPLRLVEGTDDDLGLGLNLAGFEVYVTEMICDESFLVTDDFVGEPIPATADAVAALLGRLEAKGGDFVDKFKGPVVYRMLKDESIDWAAEGAGGGRLFELVGRFMNGYDGLAVRGARVSMCVGAGRVAGLVGGEEESAACAPLPSSLGRPAEHNNNVTSPPPPSPLHPVGAQSAQVRQVLDLRVRESVRQPERRPRHGVHLVGPREHARLAPRRAQTVCGRRPSRPGGVHMGLRLVDSAA